MRRFLYAHFELAIFMNSHVKQFLDADDEETFRSSSIIVRYDNVNQKSIVQY